VADTLADVIRKIGDSLTELDILAASPTLSEADFQAIRKKRRELDRTQLALVQASFKESTQRFQKATAAIADANQELEETIDDVSKVAETLAAVSVLIGAAEDLLSIAVP
jgi:chromosome segregation ATPase